MIEPVAYYLQTRTVAEWMIYRFVVSDLLGSLAVLFFCSAFVASRIVALAFVMRTEASPMWSG